MFVHRLRWWPWRHGFQNEWLSQIVSWSCGHCIGPGTQALENRRRSAGFVFNFARFSIALLIQFSSHTTAPCGCCCATWSGRVQGFPNLQDQWRALLERCLRSHCIVYFLPTAGAFVMLQFSVDNCFLETLTWHAATWPTHLRCARQSVVWTLVTSWQELLCPAPSVWVEYLLYNVSRRCLKAAVAEWSQVGIYLLRLRLLIKVLRNTRH